MDTITTKYLQPTDTRGTRIKVDSKFGSLTYYWDYELSSEDNHLEALMTLLRLVNVNHEGRVVRGITKTEDGFVWTFPTQYNTFDIPK